MSYPQECFVNSTLLPGSLVYRRREAVASNTLIYQLDVLKKTGRFDAFKLGWHPIYGEPPQYWPVPKALFWDSDVAKWIEGACYHLHDHPHPKIDAAIHDLVKMIRTAQQPDGYINIHYTVVEPGKRFTNLRDMHELYNAGHLIEAALAHHAHYKNNDLLEPILRYVDLLHETFGPREDQIHGYPGHPEIELALLRLHFRTGSSKSLELASYFISERGNPSGVNGKEHYYDVEARNRGDDPYKRPDYHTERGGCKWYYQAHLPLVEQPTIEGHSVRAMYLLTAAADLVRIQQERDGSSSLTTLRQAVKRLWDNMVQRKMYVTGGIGAIKQYEGFGIDYFLPQGTDEGGCYAETCASIGVMMLAQRMLQYELNGQYADIMELCLYNAVLTAMSHDGESFTYENQLASSDSDPIRRSGWFSVACCPPNVLRLLGSIAGYIYTDHESRGPSDEPYRIDVHLYIPSKHEFTVSGHTYTLTQKSQWPWQGNIDFQLQTAAAAESVDIDLRLRIPAWSSDRWTVNGSCAILHEPTVENGYLRIPTRWLKENPIFTLSIPLSPRLLSPHPYTNQDTLTLARGPIVYTVEDVDNPWVQDHFKSVQLRADCTIKERAVRDDTTGDEFVALTVTDGGASVIDVDVISNGAAAAAGGGGGGGVHLDQLDAARHNPVELIQDLHFVPFYFRGNRGGRGQSRVGLHTWHDLTSRGRL